MRNSYRKRYAWLAGCLGLLIASSAVAVLLAAESGQKVYRSPFDVAFSPDGKTLAASDRTAGAVVFLNLATSKVLRQTTGLHKPAGIAWAGNDVFVTEYDTATIAQIAADTGNVLRRIPVGVHPAAVAVARNRKLLLAANMALGDVSVIDLESGKEKRRVKVLREPFHISITPDESLAVVSNLLPHGAATNPLITSSVSLIDLNALAKIADVPLPPNSTSIRQTAVSPNGNWAYAVHTVGRTTLPATQLDRGWVNTNAISIIDLKARQLYATVLLDNLAEGAADPWGLALSNDGNTAWITIAGTHQLATLNIGDLHRLLAGQAPAKPSTKMPPGRTVWTDIKADPNKRADLVNDLAALYIADLIVRSPLPGNGARGLALSPDGSTVAVCQYFTGDVVLWNVGANRAATSIPLGPQPDMDEVRRGESIFHDARYAFQHWLSCASCHPNEARADGLNWDLPNDGIGNPKSAKSLLNSHLTPPAMWRGVRDTMETASMAGFRFAMHLPPPKDVLALQDYLRSLKPEPSPYLVNGQLSEKGKRGKLVFEDPKVACATCHSGDQYTNQKVANVGTKGEFDPPEHVEFDTPTLIELWRTAPYLHDGRAATLQEMLTTFNDKDLHGTTSHLSKEQIDDLVEFLLSL